MLNPKSTCVLGNGVVVHLPTLFKELADLESKGVDFTGRLKLSDRAHIVFDFHQVCLFASVECVCVCDVD
jgi:adenylosuccinate synthase